MVQTQDIGRQVEILDRYSIDRQTIQTPAGFSGRLYRENLTAMLGELHAAGFSDATLVAVTAKAGPLTHIDGAFLNYHLVVCLGDNIFDPLYGAREPVSKELYATRAFPSENGVRLWQQTAPGKYHQELH